MPVFRYLFTEHKLKSSTVTGIIVLVLGYGMYTGNINDWISDSNSAALAADISKFEMELALRQETIDNLRESLENVEGTVLIHERNVGALAEANAKLKGAAEQRERLIAYLSNGCSDQTELFKLLEVEQ